MNKVSLFDVATGCLAVTMVTGCICGCISKINRTASKTKTEYEMVLRPCKSNRKTNAKKK